MLTSEDQELLWMGAVRFFLGQKLYNVRNFGNILIREWNTLPYKLQTLIKIEIEEAFDKDDWMRGSGKSPSMYNFPLGADCDRKSWENVRYLWNKDFKSAFPTDE